MWIVLTIMAKIIINLDFYNKNEFEYCSYEEKLGHT